MRYFSLDSGSLRFFKEFRLDCDCSTVGTTCLSFLNHLFRGVVQKSPTWCSSMLLLLNAFSAYLLARGRWATNRRVALTTALMAVGFLLLSIDDFIGLHEFLEEVMAQALSHHDARDTSTVMALGPLFGIALASLLTVLVAGAYWRAVQRENLPLLIACVGCVVTVGLAEFVYYQAGCLEHWCFRLEVLVEEGSELAAILLFLTFQSRELVALEKPPRPA